MRPHRGLAFPEMSVIGESRTCNEAVDILRVWDWTLAVRQLNIGHLDLTENILPFPRK